MESVFQYKLPVWHPQAVHFPVALLLTAAIVAAVWAVTNRPLWRQMTLVLLGLGTISGIVAYQTGEALLEQVSGTPIVDALVEAHEASALFALVVAMLAFVGLSVYSTLRVRRRAQNPGDALEVRIIFLLALLATAALIAWTAHIGGTMVWGVMR